MGACTTNGQTHVYKRYASHNNLEVAYIDGFQYDSNLCVNVTVIIAKNNFAWKWLLHDLRILPMNKEVKNQISKGRSVARVTLRNNQNLRLPPSEKMSENCLIRILWNAKTMTIFHLESEKQLELITDVLIKEITP